MSIINCKWCGNYVDTDFHSEHEEECEEVSEYEMEHGQIINS